MLKNIFSQHLRSLVQKVAKTKRLPVSRRSEFKFLLVTILLALFPVLLIANVSESIRLENYIQRQITGYLSRALPDNSYLVTVSVDAQTRRVQEVKNETTKQYLKEENITPPAPIVITNQQQQVEEPEFEILPGFEKVYDLREKKLYYRNLEAQQYRKPVVVASQEPARTFREEENNTSTDYGYNDELDIREVSLQVAFDDSLNPPLVQSLKNIIGSKMDTTFGDRATVIFSTVDLDLVRTDQGFGQQNQFPNQFEQQINQSDAFQTPDNLDNLESSSGLNTGTDINQQQTTSGDNFNASQLTNGFWGYFLDQYNSLLYLLLSILSFILLLLLFLFFLWLFLRMFAKREGREIERNDNQNNYYAEPPIPVSLSKEDNSVPSSPSPSSPSEPDYYYEDLNARAKEARFLDNFLREPLLSRKYFLNLPDDDKNELLSALVSNATKAVFRDIASNQSLGQDNVFGNDFNDIEVERARDRIFSKHIDGINQYEKIYGPQMRDVFSKLSFFTEDEIKTLFNSIGVEQAALIAKNVDSQKMVPYLNQLTEQKRKEFLRIFNNDREVTQGELEEFKRNLRYKTDELSKNIFIRKADNKFIKRKLLESSTDKKKFLESIKNEDPDFYNEYRSYMVDFDDFLRDDSQIYGMTVQASENDDIAYALIGIKNSEQQKRMLDNLPQIRRDFISGYLSSKRSTATKEEIQSAQNNILEIYRNYIV